VEPVEFNKLLGKIEQSYGIQIAKLGSFKEKVDVIPTGSLVLDEILGVGVIQEDD
jgi:RecA/RadA recombinase